jgi:gas vesicle protein
MGKFKKGLFFGSLLGAGMMWLNTTKKGKELRDEMLDHAAEVYVDLKNKVLTSEKYKKLNKNEYMKMAHELVNKYAIDNGLAENVKKMVEKLVVAQWKNLKGEIKK